MSEKLNYVLQYGGILSKKEIEIILPKYHKIELKTGNEFLSIGKVSNQIGFVEEGILRVYFLAEKGNEVTKYFTRSNQFAVDIESYYNNTPSTYSMQAVIPTTVFSMTRSTWNELSEEVPKLFMLMKSLTEVTLLNKIKDNEFLTYGTAKEKYNAFLAQYPDLANKVPLQHIASYLQITPQSLSRIRAKKD